MRICIFCEGESEKNYIQSLNRFLRECDIWDIRLIEKSLDGVNNNNYCSKIKKYKAKDVKYFTHFYAWLDFDIFKRSGKNEYEIKENVEKISFNSKKVTLLLNYMNGEDLVILHEEDCKIKEWEKICKQNNHFETPMISKVYLPLFKKNIKEGYKKGDAPVLSRDILEKCIKNINDTNIPFKSDIKLILEIILAK
jgi:hypothetical protein